VAPVVTAQSVTATDNGASHAVATFTATSPSYLVNNNDSVAAGAAFTDSDYTARNRVAPQVVRSGPSYLNTRHMQVLSDWSDAAHVIDPAGVDWRAVASGAQEVRVRQKPGDDNMMGTVKFMLPNELGIYLHDTPEKGVFADDSRFVSAGCIRLANAQGLLSWAFGAQSAPTAAPGQEKAANLPTAIPVYVTYLTVFPTEAGLRFYPDIYGRDAAPAAFASAA